MWFSLGSFMQQGSDITPRSVNILIFDCLKYISSSYIIHSARETHNVIFNKQSERFSNKKMHLNNSLHAREIRCIQIYGLQFLIALTKLYLFK